MKEINVSEAKLDLFNKTQSIESIKFYTLLHFQRLHKNMQVQSKVSSSKLRLDFSARFQDRRSLAPPLHFLKIHSHVRFLQQPSQPQICSYWTDVRMQCNLKQLECNSICLFARSTRISPPIEFRKTYFPSDELPHIYLEVGNLRL